MSGIGKIPRLQANALVFGFFMDGDQSQTPIVVGSLPHIEIPTLIQNNQQFEDVGDDSKPSNVFQKFVGFFTPDFDVDDENDTTVEGQLKFAGAQDSRVKYAVQFFINIGYTENQALALTSGLFIKSRMLTGVPVPSVMVAKLLVKFTVPAVSNSVLGSIKGSVENASSGTISHAPSP